VKRDGSGNHSRNMGKERGEEIVNRVPYIFLQEDGGEMQFSFFSRKGKKKLISQKDWVDVRGR